MKKRSLIFLGILILVQLASPFSMIQGKEKILREGERFRFKTQPIDPADPFQGRYVRLNFEDNFIPWPEERKSELHYKEPIYALIEVDQDGFAHFTGWSRQIPAAGAFLKSRHLWAKYNRPNDSSKRHYEGFFINLPFDRFYMDETKAPRAEDLARDATRTTNCWANVRIMDGKAVLEDVMVGGQSLRELAAEKE
jgi:uncharacterized membrane-anchored protein